jgi:hypothetical protein
MAHESQALPAIASVLLPGLGQLLQGRYGPAAMWFGPIVTLVVLSVQHDALLPLAMAGVLLVGNVIDAAIYSPPRPYRPLPSNPNAKRMHLDPAAEDDDKAMEYLNDV